MIVRFPRSAWRPIAAVMLLVLIACTSTTKPSPSVGSSSPPAPASPAPSVSLSEGPGPIGVSGRVRVQAPAGGSFLVYGAYPHVESSCRDAEQPRLTARYPGTLAARCR